MAQIKELSRLCNFGIHRDTYKHKRSRGKDSYLELGRKDMPVKTNVYRKDTYL
jgi:hypothetical protein